MPTPDTGLPYRSPIVAVSAIEVPSAGAEAGEASSVEPLRLGAPAWMRKGWLVSPASPVPDATRA